MLAPIAKARDFLSFGPEGTINHPSDASVNLDDSRRWAIRDSAVVSAREEVTTQLAARGLTVDADTLARRHMTGGGSKLPPPGEPPSVGTGGSSDVDDELMRQFIKDRENYDGTVPIEHILTGRIRQGVIRDVIFNPDRIYLSGRWGRMLEASVTMPDGQVIRLAVHIGKTRQNSGKTFKVNSAFPLFGDGVTELRAERKIYMKTAREEA